jgi:hypothetical protein
VSAVDTTEVAPVVRLVCGGQTGADRAAVDFALSRGVTYGGWVPRGGWAEDFPEPPGLLARYPYFVETESHDPDERTGLNVRDSDATAIIGLGSSPSPGTLATRHSALVLACPLLEIDALSRSSSNEFRAFLSALVSPITLNIAGPRESEAPGLYLATFAFLTAHADLIASSP